MRALIVGAATGIGAAVVEKWKAKGFEVVALDIAKPAQVDQWLHVDLSEPSSIDEAVGQLSGTFDCLVSNAGLPPRDGMEEKILAVNFMGLVRCTTALLPMLNKGAAIVNTASRAGMAWRENIDQVKALMQVSNHDALRDFIAKEGIDPVRAYNLSKEALIVWSMAQTERLLELDLRMNTVSPAAVSTGILNDFASAFGDRMVKNVERVGRPGTADEIADVIVFLSSPESRWLKGVDITIDGGMTAVVQTENLGL